MTNSGDDPEVEVYFGCGCFWHVQHEFVCGAQRQHDAVLCDAVAHGLLSRWAPARVEEMTKLCRTGSLKLRKNLGRMGLGS